MAVPQPKVFKGYLRGAKAMNVVIAGDPLCGKTTLWRAFKKGYYDSEECHTNYLDVQLMACNDPICLSLDEAPSGSDPDSCEIRSRMYIEAKAVILCINLNQSESLSRIEEYWYREVRDYNAVVSVFLVGLKWDDDSERTVLTEDAEEVGRKINAYSYFEFTPETVEGSRQILLRSVAEIVFAQNFSQILRSRITK